LTGAAGFGTYSIQTSALAELAPVGRQARLAAALDSWAAAMPSVTPPFLLIMKIRDPFAIARAAASQAPNKRIESHPRPVAFGRTPVRFMVRVNPLRRSPYVPTTTRQKTTHFPHTTPLAVINWKIAILSTNSESEIC
jgi:hypothetical protein